MLHAQGVMDLFLELNVRVGFVKHGDGSVISLCYQNELLHCGERTELSARPRSVLEHYATLTWVAFDFALVVVGRCTFSTPSRNSAVTFVLSASSGSVKVRRKVPKHRSMRW